MFRDPTPEQHGRLVEQTISLEITTSRLSLGYEYGLSESSTKSELYTRIELFESILVLFSNVSHRAKVIDCREPMRILP